MLLTLAWTGSSLATTLAQSAVAVVTPHAGKCVCTLTTSATQYVAWSACVSPPSAHSGGAPAGKGKVGGGGGGGGGVGGEGGSEINKVGGGAGRAPSGK